MPTKIQTHQIDNSHCAQNSHAHHATPSATLPPPVCIAAFIFHRHRLHHCSLFLSPTVLASLLITAIWGWQVQIYLGSARNCGHLVIFQQGNKGSGPVIGRLIAFCVAAFIFCRHCHHCHRLFFGGGGSGGGGGSSGGDDGSGDGSGGGIGGSGGGEAAVARTRAVAVEMAVVRVVVRVVAIEWW